MGYWWWAEISEWLYDWTHTHTHTHSRSTFLSFLTVWQPQGSLTVAQGSGLRVHVFQQTRRKLLGLFHLAVEVLEHHFCPIQLTSSKSEADPDSGGEAINLFLPGKTVFSDWF